MKIDYVVNQGFVIFIEVRFLLCIAGRASCSLVAEYHQCGGTCHLFVKQWLYHFHFDKYSETFYLVIALFLILHSKNHNVAQTLCVCVCVCVCGCMHVRHMVNNFCLQNCLYKVQNLSFMIQVFWYVMHC